VFEADLSPASSTEVTNGGAIRSLCFYSTLLNYTIRYSNKFTFTYYCRCNRVCFIQSVLRGSVSGTFSVYPLWNVHD
jgi:hypothetical protein